MLPAPVLYDPPADAIQCPHCGGLVERPPIAFPAVTDGGPALERYDQPFPHLVNRRQLAETVRVDLRDTDADR